jgi:L-threonylcarbamoyladenylate synthase
MLILPESQEAWRRVTAVVACGGVVVFPTDTVYGVGCDPHNQYAIARVYKAKERSALKALPLLLSGPDAAVRVALELPESARILGQALWPGALTLVVLRNRTLPVELGGGDTIALRVPAHDGLRAFIASCGGALAATSANLSGEPDALDAQSAARYLEGRVDIIIDGGPVQGGVPSTVVDCTGPDPTILREGALSALEITRTLQNWEK